MKHLTVEQRYTISVMLQKGYPLVKIAEAINKVGTPKVCKGIFPKKTDFNSITDEYIQYVEDKLNNSPRKRLNFSTPNEIFNKFVKKILTKKLHL